VRHAWQDSSKNRLRLRRGSCNHTNRAAEIQPRRRSVGVGEGTEKRSAGSGRRDCRG
jgi:hypothetical protein